MPDEKDSTGKDAGEQVGKVQGGGLGGNRLGRSRHGASTDETDLTKGERRRGGQGVT